MKSEQETADETSRKRPIELAANKEDPESKKIQKIDSESLTSFEKNTVEVRWSPKDCDRKYIVRYLNEHNDFSYEDVEDWPTTLLPFHVFEPPAGEDNEPRIHHVVGAIWTADTFQLVGFYGSDSGDSHIELNGDKAYEFVQDLATLTGDLCDTIEPSLGDLFDDGSGTERDVRELSAELFKCPALETLYSDKQ